MGRFGRAAAWRNMAMYGTLDETGHGQIQTYFPYTLLAKEPKADWAHKAYHTNEWGVLAARSLFDDMFAGNDAVSTAIQLTFCFETGFTNLQFLGMAADAMGVGDIEFSSLISSIQTDEARHAQQGEPTMKILIEIGRKDVAQKLIDHMFWRSWKIFSLLTGLSMDYYTPLEHRRHSFKEFMAEWINKQFVDQFTDFGLELPWYWNDHYQKEINWLHHAYHLGVWFWRPTVWWNPDAGVSPQERDWLEEKYPGWNDSFGKYWDVITENARSGNIAMTYPETLPMVCNICHVPVCTPAGFNAGYLDRPRPADPRPQRPALHVLLRAVQVDLHREPPPLPGTPGHRRPIPGRNDPAAGSERRARVHGSLTRGSGVDATDFAWAHEPAPLIIAR